MLVDGSFLSIGANLRFAHLLRGRGWLLGGLIYRLDSEQRNCPDTPAKIQDRRREWNPLTDFFHTVYA